MTRQVVVTRPASEATAWLTALQAAGFEPVALPLLAFGPPVRMDLLAAAQQSVQTFDAVMFVSPQAVQAFFDQNIKQKTDLAQSNKQSIAINSGKLTRIQRYWAPGPGTAQALVRAGIPAARIDQPPADASQFDSEALWAVVRAQVQAGTQVLVVRGEVQAAANLPQAGQGSGREWLADQCRAAGSTVHLCAAYRRQPPVWTPDQSAAAAKAASNGAVWLFSSSEGVAHLQALMPGQSWQRACALVTHPRIAQTVSAWGFGAVQVCRPTQADVLQTLNNGSFRLGQGGQPSGSAPKMGCTS